MSLVEPFSHESIVAELLSIACSASAEDQLARIYQFGLLIARLHANIARAVLGQHYIGGSFEGWWKSRLTEEDRLGFLQAALDAACVAGKGYGLDIRLK